jgi:hypothetical protein
MEIKLPLSTSPWRTASLTTRANSPLHVYPVSELPKLSNTLSNDRPWISVLISTYFIQFIREIFHSKTYTDITLFIYLFRDF